MSGMSRLILLICGAAALAVGDEEEQIAALHAINTVRLEHGLNSLDQDRILAATAENFAADLAARGALSHRDSSGGTALDRYRRLGGTAFRVGEILGAGEDLAPIVDRWIESDSHHAVLTSSAWTHAGIGVKRRGKIFVFVALFARLRFADLRIKSQKAHLIIEGRLIGAGGRPVLQAGGADHQPVWWRPDTGALRFVVPAGQVGYFGRLGVREEDGTFTVTDIVILAVASRQVLNPE